MTFIGMLLYFGALFVPVFYFMITHFKGPAMRAMLIGTGLQVFWSLSIWGFVFFSSRAGHQDAWKFWGMLLPVNLVSLIGYGVILFVYARKARAQK